MKQQPKGKKETRRLLHKQAHGQRVSMGKRFVAYLVDFYIGMLLCSLPIVLGNGVLNGSDSMQMNLFYFQGATLYIIGAISLFIGYIYYVYVPKHIWKGQTIAKHWMHIKIVKMNGEEVDGKALFRRQIIGMFVVEGAVVSCSTLLRQMLTYATSINFVDVLIYSSLAITVLSSFIMVCTTKQRMLHDYIGTTKVIQIV